MPDELAPASFPLAYAAERLGTTTEAVRMRLRRGSLRGFKQGRQWFVYLPDEAATEVRTGRPHATAQEPVSDRSRPHSDRKTTARDRDELLTALREENAFLRRQVDEAATERAEMRRLLGNAQQQVSALLATPAQITTGTPATAPTMTAIPPEAAEVANTTAAAEAALKEAGIKGKRQRRKWAERLAGVFGRSNP